MWSSLDILSWIIVGVLAGWAVSLITGTNQQYGWIENSLVGIIGAVVGGFPFALFTSRQIASDWNTGSFVMAVGGALALLVVLHLVRRS